MKVFIFNAPPNLGKDYICKKLMAEFGSAYSCHHQEFKRELFKETANYYKVPLKWFMDSYDRVGKEKPDPNLDNNSRRRALQIVSEEYLKPKYGKACLGIKSAQTLTDPDGVYFYSDGGFNEEQIPVINKCGKNNYYLIRLKNDNYSFTKNDTRRYIYLDKSIAPNQYDIFYNKDSESLQKIIDFVGRKLKE